VPHLGIHKALSNQAEQRPSLAGICVCDVQRMTMVQGFTFPVGISRTPNSDPERAERIQTKASWVNVLQALGLPPEDDSIYEMQDAPSW
jgi:hypothetical protein